MHAGFSLIEVMVALALVVLLGVATARGLTHSQRATYHARLMDEACRVLRSCEAAWRTGRDPEEQLPSLHPGWTLTEMEEDLSTEEAPVWRAWRLSAPGPVAWNEIIYVREENKIEE